MTSTFHWHGINEQGIKLRGKITAKNYREARHDLLMQNIIVVSLYKTILILDYFKQPNLKRKSIIDFIQSLYWLLQSGLPLTETLTTIAQSTDNVKLKALITTINEKITQGNSLSDTLKQFPKAFPPLYQRLIDAGEKSGQLETILLHIITQEKIVLEIKSKAKKAMVYPAAVLCVAILVSIGLLLFVVPQFQKIYQNFNAQLPHATQLFITFSHSLSTYGWLYSSALLGLFLAFMFIKKRSRRFQFYLHRIILSLPIIKNYIISNLLSQWSQVFTTCLSSGIALMDALAISNSVIQNPVFQRQLQIAYRHTQEGHSLSSALNNIAYFPKQAKQLITIGEQGGTLQVMTEKISQLYFQQFQQQMDYLSKLIEPVIMVIISSIIAIIIIAMYLPIFRMGSVI